MNLLIHATKEGKFLNHANAVEKKKETKIARKYGIRYVTKIAP